MSLPARRRWQMHGLVIEGVWRANPIGQRWSATFAPLQPSATEPDLVFDLALVDQAPAAPAGEPDFRQGDLLAYYTDGAAVLAHFPRYGQLRLNLARSTTSGVITPAALATYGVFEDLLAIGLSPHLRRRGYFLLHAFAAAPSAAAPAVLLAGDIGAGKTTTGLALLHAGWKLLSNDSPILAAGADAIDVLAYPGLLSAYPDSLQRFPELAHLARPGAPREKTIFAAEASYPGVWLESARAGALIFPQIEARADHLLEPLPPAGALRQILPHAIEQWDRAMIPAHLKLLNQLIQSVPAYRLRLGPDTNSLPLLLAHCLNPEDTRPLKG
jgi:hypothetical protein